MAKKTAKVADPVHTGDVLPAEEPLEVALINTNGGAIVSFMANLLTFFRGARALEEDAKQQLQVATAFVPPTNSGEDERLQLFVKTMSAKKKAAEDYWGICAVFHNVHRQLTGGRGRPIDALEKAAAKAQLLHNNYVAAENRRARIEQDRIRVQREEEARVAREKELADLEAAAVKAEEGSKELSDRERVFATFVADGVQGQRAASMAGFKDAFKSAARLMSLPKIQQAIKAIQDAKAIREQAEAKREAPLDVAEIEEVVADVTKAPGASDRTTWTGEVTDEAAFIAAVIAGKDGIPWDVLTVKQAKLTEYAREMKGRLNRWPGVRAVPNTRTV